MKKVIYIIMCAVMLTACETELEYNGPGSDPMLYVYAELTDSAGAGNDIFVGHTSFFVNGIDTSRLEDAVIEIARGDGNFVETGAEYVTPGDLRPGEQLRLRVNQKDFGTANAIAVCPPKIDVEILSVEEKKTKSRARSFDVKMKFLCDGVEIAGDFYWRILVYAHNSHVFRGDTVPGKESMLWESDDPVLQYDDAEENIDIWNALFGDPMFGYQPIKLKDAEYEAEMTLNGLDDYAVYYANSSGDVERKSDMYEWIDSIELVIDIASEDMVKYLDAKEECGDMALNLFKEPSLMFTNMDNGTGLFAIKSKIRKMIILEE